MFVLALLTITIIPLATADYLVYNGSKDEIAYVAYAYYEPGGNSADDITKAGRLIRPSEHEKRDSYLLHCHPSKAFSLLESSDGRILEVGEGISRSELVKTSGFYKYPNGGLFNLGGPLKYGAKTINFYVGGTKKWGGSWRSWSRTFSLPGEVLYARLIDVNDYGRGGASFRILDWDGSTVTAKGRIEDGRVIRGQLDVEIEVYYRK